MRKAINKMKDKNISKKKRLYYPMIDSGTAKAIVRRLGRYLTNDEFFLISSALYNRSLDYVFSQMGDRSYVIGLMLPFQDEHILTTKNGNLFLTI